MRRNRMSWKRLQRDNAIVIHYDISVFFRRECDLSPGRIRWLPPGAIRAVAAIHENGVARCQALVSDNSRGYNRCTTGSPLD